MEGTELVPQAIDLEEPERSTDEIRQDIAARRESIADTVDKLGDQLQRKLDWREHVGEHPLIALGAAAGLGVLLSRVVNRRPAPPTERMFDALAETVEDMSGRLRRNVDVWPLSTSGPSMMTGVKAAAMGYVTKAAASYVKKRLGLDGRAVRRRR